ncbi:hypothetical protein [Nocardia vaccinii]|uniref:hypothetical protein n=1 Tax=Nocardia vaccinii TaxID=1822 RepID=UPI0008295FFB|nr:hypothetical protein [Nocardia vaccinii]
MTTELDITRPSAGLALAPAANMAAHLNDHLAALHAADQIAALIHKTVRAYDGGVDKDGKKRGGQKEAAVAIYHGQLIGLDPIQSLQNIFVVHGTPSMYARTMKALLIRAGHQVETVESNDRRAIVRAKHRAASEWEESTWTIERAQKAGYTSNAKYRTDPEGMLYARALADACRRAAPDVLLGMAYSAEELETDQVPVRATSERIHVAEVLDQDDTAEAPKVQQWQAPATDVQTEVAPPTQPDQDDHAAAAGEQETVPPEPMSTVAQQRKVAILLEQHGVEDKDAKLAYLAEQFKREFTSSKELTKREASELIEFLERPIETGDAATQLPMDGAEGGE